MHEDGIGCVPQSDISFRLTVRIGTRDTEGKRVDDELNVYRQGTCACGRHCIKMAAILTPRWRTQPKITSPEQMLEELRAVLQEFTEAYTVALDEGMTSRLFFYGKMPGWDPGLPE